MNQKFKKYLQFGILFLAISLFINCEKEEGVFIENTKLSIKRISFNELKTKGKIYKEFLNLKRKRESSVSLRTSDDNFYNFVLDTTNINLAELDSYNSVTIPIYRGDEVNPYLIENFFIHKTSTNEYKSLIFRYHLSETDYTNLENLLPINELGVKTTIVSFDNYDFLNNTRSINSDGYIGQPFWYNGVCSVYDHVVMYMYPDGTEGPGPGSTIVPCGGCDCEANPDTNITDDNSSGTETGSNVVEFDYTVENNSNTSSDNFNPFENLGSSGNGGSGNNNVGFQSAITKPTPIFNKQFIQFLNDSDNNFTSEQLDFLSTIQGFNTKKAIQDLLEENEYSSESLEVAQYAVDVKIANPDINPLLRADCRSFEFAKPPGALQRGCAVEDFNHSFYAMGVNSNGAPYFGYVDSTIPLIYFTMPNWMTNGQAANATARAVTNAVHATDVYFFTNPYDNENQVGAFFRDALIAQLSLVGGSVSTTYAPFDIPNPATYITSVYGLSDPYDCD